MDIQKEREAFEKHASKFFTDSKEAFKTNGDQYLYDEVIWMWDCWIERSKAQAVQEQDQQVWATSNLTWKDIAFRALSCKVLKSTENWVHVKNIACVGSTTASLICKKLGVNPDGTKFELIEAQEPTND